MISCLENGCYGDIEEEQYSWVDVNGPVMVSVEVQVVGGGAVPWDDDVLQTKQSAQEHR